MANQGVYREAGAAGALPLPRARLSPLTVGVALLALASIVMPPALLVVAGGSVAGGWTLFRNGGGSMWLILLLDVVAPVVAAALGAFVLRDRRVPAGLLFAAAGLPFAVALLGAWSGHRMVVGAIRGESVDPEQKARILAEGIAESMSNDIFGGFVACGAAIVAAAAAASALASIDVASVSRVGPKASARGAIGAGVAGAAWCVATVVLGGVRMRAAGALVLLPALPVFVLVPFAVVAGRAAAVLRAWHDRAEASRAAGAMVVAALSALLAVLALERAVDSNFAARAFAAISGESVDDSLRARILVVALDAGRLAPIAYALHAVLGAATFGLALAPALGNGRNPATPSAALAGAFGFALLAGAFALAHSRTSAPRAVAPSVDASLEGVALPVVIQTFSHKGPSPLYGTRLVVRHDGSGDGSVEPSSCASPRFTVYADRAATVAMLRTRMGAPRSTSCPRNLVLVARREHSPEIDARLGDLAAYLGTTATIPAAMDADFSSGRRAARAPVMRVTMVADDAVEVDGARVALPLLPSTAPALTGAMVSLIQYVFRPADTLERVIQTIVAVETAYDARLRTSELEREIDDGARPPPPPPPPPPYSGTPVLRIGAVAVSGRLPPEVIQRIVRKNQGRMRLCYENGLRTNPTLHGRVTVKFVIDRSGAVSTAADGGSELPDGGVVACVVRVFGSLSFPQTEGGIVTVSYPIDFQSGS